jgi:hypothetical protein
MTHHCGLSLSIIICRFGGGVVPFAFGPKYSLGSPDSGILLYLKTFVTNEGVLKDGYTSWDKYVILYILLN